MAAGPYPPGDGGRARREQDKGRSGNERQRGGQQHQSLTREGRVSEEGEQRRATSTTTTARHERNQRKKEGDSHR